MKRIIFVLLFLLIVPPLGKPGAYKTYSALAYCTDEITCLHEIGHMIDYASDWISQSNEFRLGLAMYLQKAPYDELYVQITYTLSTTKQNQLKEVYAWFFAYAGGDVDNIPEDVKPYFNREVAKSYMRHNNSHIMWFPETLVAKFTNLIMKR